MKFVKLLILTLVVVTAKKNIALSQTASAKQATDNLKVAAVKVKGISCSMDLKMISANVEKIKGVNSCKVVKQGTTTTFDVKYDPMLVKEKEIFATIENTGSCENPDEKTYKVIKK